MADQTTVEHTLKGQGVTAGAAARVGGGAAAGAILGKVIGGKTGAIVGGVAGAAGGAVAANQTADRDVVVAPGAKVTFTLTSDFTITL
jgi:outer membrane lipoprotein SlyB